MKPGRDCRWRARASRQTQEKRSLASQSSNHQLFHHCYGPVCCGVRWLRWLDWLMTWLERNIQEVTSSARYIQYTGLLEWAHTFVVVAWPNCDLKFSSLIQRVFLMRLEHSDLIYNFYIIYLVSLVILTQIWCSQHQAHRAAFVRPVRRTSLFLKKYVRTPSIECIYLCPNAYYRYISGQQTQFSIKIESGTTTVLYYSAIEA